MGFLIAAICIGALSVIFAIQGDFEAFGGGLVIAACLVVCWIFWKKTKKLALSKAKPTSPKAGTPTPVQQPQPQPIKKMNVYPLKKNGQPLRYAYTRNIVPMSGVNVAQAVLGNSEKEVDIRPNGANIELLYNGMVFATIPDEEKAKMVSDWEKKGLPCNAILLAPGDKVNLRFYKDKRIGNEYREQDVLSLLSYKSEDKQDTIAYLENGDELDFEEDYEHETVSISSVGNPIGRLPKKYAVKFLEEGAYAVFFEKAEANEENINIPFIRIYW